MGRGVMFVIFGATGDLSKRKLIPAIYNLSKRKKINDFHIIAVGRKNITSEKIIDSAKKYIKDIQQNVLKNMKSKTSYVRADFNQEKDYERINLEIKRIEKKGIHNKIFYLATGSNNFEKITTALKKSGLAKEKKGEVKVVYEKPFGRGEKSSEKLNKHIKSVFREDQIYRIDHYLGKELVETILLLRFTNQVLEPLWNNKYIKNIQIILDEKIGIEERGPYYDTYGAVMDMVQNHVLQLLGLINMKKPKTFSGNDIRNSKAKLLKNVQIKDSILGQYIGYKNEKGISKNSKTETFASVVFEIKNSRWLGVPIFIRTGKMLGKENKKIIINFKDIKCPLKCPIKNNSLEIRIHPDEGVELNLNSKVPGKLETTQVKLDFCYSCKFGQNTPEGYENLFIEIIQGNQTTFTRTDELQAQWKIIDKIKKNRLYKYSKGSLGPKEMKAFEKKWGIKWD